MQASDLYTTANAARDVALLLRRLATGKVDFYGDSYGTFFGQAFTARYARMLRSVTLDSAYPVSQKNPFYPHMIPTARHAFNISCRRSVACHRAAPGSSWARIGGLARYLRRHPVTGRTRTPFGRMVTEHVGVLKLSEMVNDAGSDNGVYRELDPAARALLRDHDPVPLLRLTEQDVYTGTSGPVREFNDGLYQATTCLDYPQPFSYSQTPAQRAASYARALAALPANEFAPFTVHEWVTEPEEEFDACLDWPAPPPGPADRHPRALRAEDAAGAGAVRRPRLAHHAVRGPPDHQGHGTVGALDPDPQRHARQRDGRHVRLRFRAGADVHQRPGRAQDDERLVRDQDAGGPGGRHVPGDAQGGHARDRPPGNQAGRTGRRLAAVGAAAVGDAVERWYYGDGVRGWGLRGGTFRFSGSGSRIGIRLRLVRWTTDTRVSGTVRWNQVTGRIRARVTIAGPGGIAAAVRLRYSDYVPHPKATLSGSYRGPADRRHHARPVTRQPGR